MRRSVVPSMSAELAPVASGGGHLMDIEKLIERLRTELKSKVDLVFQQAKELDRRHLLLQEQEAELEQVKRERDAAVEFLESAIRYSTNPCEGCKADCIDAGSDAAERVDQCGAFEWRGKKEDEHEVSE